MQLDKALHVEKKVERAEFVGSREPTLRFVQCLDWEFCDHRSRVFSRFFLSKSTFFYFRFHSWETSKYGKLCFRVMGHN
jgi:hypothetical protein